MHKRTGIRKPIKHLKAWRGPAAKDWTLRLTPRLSIARVDEDLPPSAKVRKSWYVALTQDRDLLKTLTPIQGIPRKGKTLLLFEDDAVALVQQLIESGLIITDRNGRAQNGHEYEWEWVAAKRRRMIRTAKKANRQTRRPKMQ